MKHRTRLILLVFLNSHNKQRTLEHFPMHHGEVSVKDLMRTFVYVSVCRHIDEDQP